MQGRSKRRANVTSTRLRIAGGRHFSSVSQFNTTVSEGGAGLGSERTTTNREPSRVTSNAVIAVGAKLNAVADHLRLPHQPAGAGVERVCDERSISHVEQMARSGIDGRGTDVYHRREDFTVERAVLNARRMAATS